MLKLKAFIRCDNAINYLSYKEILKNKYTAGIDSIPNIIRKKCVNYLLDPLTHLCNALFETGVFIEVLKTSKVIHLHKNGNTQNICLYRPISTASWFFFLKSMKKLFSI